MYSFKKFLLMEYNEEKNWVKHGDKFTQKLKGENLLPSNTDPRQVLHNTIQKFDPTPHKEYAGWISHHYATGGINKYEDIGSRVGPALKKFHEAKVKKGFLQKHGVNPDINTHKGITPLEDAVDKLPKEEVHTTKAENEQAHKNTTHLEDEHWHVKVPHTEHASCHYGKGTRWCTAATKSDNLFHSYRDIGPLHIFIPKKPNYPGEKYQLHAATGTLMDEKDRPVGSRPEVPSFHRKNERNQNIFHNRPSKIFDKVLHDHIHENGEMEKIVKEKESEVNKVKATNIPTLQQKLKKQADAQVLRKNLNFRHHDVLDFVARHGSEEHIKHALNTIPTNLIDHNQIATKLLQRNSKAAVDHFVQHKDPRFRRLAAMQHYGAREKLLNDPDKSVRMTARGH